ILVVFRVQLFLDQDIDPGCAARILSAAGSAVDLHQCPRNPIDDDAGGLRNRHNRARSEDTNLAATGHSITYRELGAGGAGLPATERGRPLPPALLYRACDPAELPFELV